MAQKIDKLINELKTSNLFAKSPCGHEFKLKESILFDGTKPFPKEALETQAKLKAELKDRAEDIKKKRKLATKKAEITTKSVNIGKNLEKVLPTMKDFKWELSDCRVLGDPIDLITFNGFSNNLVNSLSFIEVKTGKARLNARQKAIKDAILDKRVSYKEFK